MGFFDWFRPKEVHTNIDENGVHFNGPVVIRVYSSTYLIAEIPMKNGQQFMVHRQDEVP